MGHKWGADPILVGVHSADPYIYIYIYAVEGGHCGLHVKDYDSEYYDRDLFHLGLRMSNRLLQRRL